MSRHQPYITNLATILPAFNGLKPFSKRRSTALVDPPTARPANDQQLLHPTPGTFILPCLSHVDVLDEDGTGTFYAVGVMQ